MQVLTPASLKSEKQVIIYGTDHCPYCVKAKSLLTKLQVEFDYRDCDKSQKYENERAALEVNLKYDTVPMIFVNNKFIGGCSDLHELHDKGQFLSMLK